MEKIMAVGYDLDSSREEMQLAEQYPFVWAAVGVHPENCEGLPADWLGQLAGMLSSPRVKALGEIGLDRHYEGCDKVLQAEVFERQLQLAKTLDVPVIIHSRDACEETDCPYMAPAPHRGEKSHSGMIKYTAAKMAELKGVSPEEMIEICRENGERLFRI